MSQSPDPFHGLPHRHYQIVLADPPWKFKVYDEATGSSRAASNHYEVMDTAAICRLPVKEFAARDAALYLWVTAPFLQIAFDVMRAWGFPYSTNAVWTKDKIGTGFWFRSQHELLLVGKRGKFRAPAPAHRPSSVISAPRREHSRKPDELYSIIERAYPDLPRIELFARRARPGWAAWGDEVPSAAHQNGNRSGAFPWAQGGTMRVRKLYKNRVLSPGMVRCHRCGGQFDPRVQSAACHKMVRHFPIVRTSEWLPPAAPPAPEKPREIADRQSDFCLLWNETQLRPRVPR